MRIRGDKIQYLFIGLACLVLGIVGFFITDKKTNVYQKDIVDISANSGYDWDDLKSDMHVKLTVDNSFGYYMYTTNTKRTNDVSRNYMILDYNQSKKTYGHMMGVEIQSHYFKQWEKLVKNTSSKEIGTFETVTIEGYTAKMDSEQAGYFREYLRDLGFSEKDINEMMSPYFVVAQSKAGFLAYKYFFVAVTIGSVAFLVILIISHNHEAEEKAARFEEPDEYYRPEPLRPKKNEDFQPYIPYERPPAENPAPTQETGGNTETSEYPNIPEAPRGEMKIVKSESFGNFAQYYAETKDKKEE